MEHMHAPAAPHLLELMMLIAIFISSIPKRCNYANIQVLKPLSAKTI
jgi:hypothetical protein